MMKRLSIFARYLFLLSLGDDVAATKRAIAH